MTVTEYVLDHGYLRSLGRYGDDLTVVNAARVSYSKESATYDRCAVCGERQCDCRQVTGEPAARIGPFLEERDKRLIRYLIEHRHWSPFRHAFLPVEVKCPLFVAREWWRHAVGAATTEEGTPWNETSRRYDDSPPEFYLPSVWRGRSATNKQGSAGVVEDEAGELAAAYDRAVSDGLYAYEQALAQGVAPELARLFLPAYGLYTRFRWTPSLQAALHFLSLRTAPDAQWEIRQYAQALERLLWPAFPTVMYHWQEINGA